MRWGLTGGISIYADSGPPRYVLWCCSGICHEVLTFFQIGCGHTVVLELLLRRIRFKYLQFDQSHYIEVAQETENEIWAGFGPVSSTEKKLGWLWATFEGCFFMFSRAKKVQFFKNIYPSIRTEKLHKMKVRKPKRKFFKI